MKPTREQAIEWALELGINPNSPITALPYHNYAEFCIVHEIYSLVQRAYAEGVKEEREMKGEIL